LLLNDIQVGRLTKNYYV